MTSPTVEDLLQYQKFAALDTDQVANFMKYGFVRIPGAIPEEKCDSWTANVWHRLGFDPNDKSTWTSERTHMSKHHAVSAKEIAPKAWAAICELCGGEDRLYPGVEMWTDAFIVNFGSPETEGQTVLPRELDNWHVDGDFFIHFLDSPEQGLLVIPCWSDVVENGGATWICDEGPKRIGKILYDNPEGLNPMLFPRTEKPQSQDDHSIFVHAAQAADDRAFHEMTGKKGDVILMHPLMLHSASKNGRRAIRIITNPLVALSAPFEFNRANPAEYSLVELKTILDLGGPAKFSKGWKITGQREMFVPPRVARQRQMQQEENDRLQKLDLPLADDSLVKLPEFIAAQQAAKAGA